MKQIYILLSILITACCWACSEDGLKPSEPYHPYEPDASASDAKLRQDFYEANGVYLLFNDTLSTDPLNKIDPNYSFFGYAENTTYEFAYQKTLAQKEESAQIVSGLVDKMVAHNLAKPYAVLVVDEITVIVEDEYDGTLVSRPAYLSSLSCFIVAMAELGESDEDVYGLIANMAASSLMAKYEADLEGFFELGMDGIYDMHEDYKDYYLPEEYDYCLGLGDEYIEEFYKIGFLVNTKYDKLCSKSEDMASYLNLLFSMTEEEVYEKFGDYDLVLQKYEEIIQVAQKAGIKF